MATYLKRCNAKEQYDINLSHQTIKIPEIQVSYKPKIKSIEQAQVTTTHGAHKIFYERWDKNKINLQEQFKVLMLNRSNNVIGIYEAFTGGIAGVVADPRLIFATALKSCASGIIIAHNHPSGNLKPSIADINLTRKIRDGGHLLDIIVLDHLIITSNGYYSFADEGLLLKKY